MISDQGSRDEGQPMISIFDMFSVGIGPSSSHTVGPMRAALQFARHLQTEELLAQVESVTVGLYGSLGATGKAHGCDKALVLGLLGEMPETTDVDAIDRRLDQVRADRRLNVLQRRSIRFDVDRDLVCHKRERLPLHVNGMRFGASNGGRMLADKTFYSVGGGFIVAPDEHGLSIGDLMLENERRLRGEQTVRSGLLELWQVMQECVVRGCATSGTLPGRLQVRRRAAGMLEKLRARQGATPGSLDAMDWVNLYALAVNEENAPGGRVVTAPTNGAAGVIPAVLHYYRRFCEGADDDGVVRFLLVAGAIGLLYKYNASVSGAEVGCQGEVGSACSMAAGGLTEVLDGSPAQVEHAAEIGMEHNLGLTCDPVGGLVQIPCIERNAIKTMRDTGRDMKSKYKETARGGLAVNVVEC